MTAKPTKPAKSGKASPSSKTGKRPPASPTVAADAERTFFRVRTYVAAPSRVQDTLGAPTDAADGAGRGTNDPGLLSRWFGGGKASRRQTRRRTPLPPPEEVVETKPSAPETVTVMIIEPEPEGPGSDDAVDSYRSASGLTVDDTKRKLTA
ncbi:MAG: hypothetical protein WCZ23_08695 [Rhodospirillaceae bacterium]